MRDFSAMLHVLSVHVSSYFDKESNYCISLQVHMYQFNVVAFLYNNVL